ncbi:hypothetical protein BJF85_20835 [Saccharomonospora sp. CUA-673]|uniref:hypothetical protein n=1 Tax=Saccharomonospora sp. CUA-673 TaxID=1904969 RepID=UPI000964F05D|nr:hypothetical protein [Saccharomonospora sp. CUA-673]OLT43989.1 hypothetical protein BJF85_20835 [Saccharomonospora sp. CUA-673]
MNRDEQVAATTSMLSTYLATGAADEPDFDVDTELVHEAYRLLVDECGVDDLARIGSGDLTRLLLELLPQARPDTDPNALVDAVDVLADFAFDGAFIDEDLHGELLEELDTAETAMFGSLVDPRVPGNETSLKELFNLPDRLGPIRLPDEPELAERARGSELLTRVRTFAEQRLDGASTADAAAAAGIPDGDVATVSRLADELGFITIDLDTADADTTEGTGNSAGDAAGTRGDTFDEWPDGDDDTVLTVWGHALNWLLAWSLPLDAEDTGEETLDFTGTSAWFAPLFMSWRVGLPVGAISDIMADIAGDELTADRAKAAWTAWTAEHGDPAEVLLSRLAGLGAVELTESGAGSESEAATGGTLARISDLGAASLRAELIESDMDIPLLPEPDEVTAADLVEVLMHGLDGELEQEASTWFAARTTEEAADALLAEAAAGDAMRRAGALGLVRAYTGAEAEPAWRRAVDAPNVGLHARNELAAMHGEDTGLSDDEIGWLVVDTIAAQLPLDTGHPEDAEELQGLLTRLVSAETVSVVESMWRADHPDVVAVLTALGDRHPDKAIAKAARKASRKAADRDRS